MIRSVGAIVFAGALSAAAMLLANVGRDSYAGPDMRCAVAAADPSEYFAGGGTTVRDSAIHAFGRSPGNLTQWAVRWPLLRRGKMLFDRKWDTILTDGRHALGPLFNNSSCAGCHVRDGRGAPPTLAGAAPVQMVFRLGSADDAVHADTTYGDQLSLFSAPGIVGEGGVAITRENIRGTFADGTTYELRRPGYTPVGLRSGPLAPGTRISARVGPPVFGMGLLEAIPADAILARADPDDRNHDGISGRPNYSRDLRTGVRVLGRFGWKAGQPTVAQQVARALVADMGIRSRLFPDDGSSPHHADALAQEISAKEFDELAFYTTLTGVPARRGFDDEDVLHGKGIFLAIGCAGCHAPSFTTGTIAGFPEISGQRIYPYTDLLLHDMGSELADNCAEGLATGREWRTPPLWGIGLTRIVSGHTRLLHDGRARNAEEAILWHGGEGAASRDFYRRLKREDREAVLRFLGSL